MKRGAESVSFALPELYEVTASNRRSPGWTSDTTTETFTQELRLSGVAFSGRLQWVGGLYYADQDDRLLQVVTTRGAGVPFDLGTDVTYFGDQRTDS